MLAGEHGRDSGSAGRPLTIVLAVPTLEVGGTERQLVRLAREFTERGHRVRVVVLSQRGPLAADLEAAGVVVHSLGLPRPAGVVRLLGLPWKLRQWRVDVTHAFLFWPSVLVLPAARVAGIRHRISGRRNLGSDIRGPVRRVLAYVANRSTTAMIANAQAVAETVPRGGRPAVLWVVPNGVDAPAGRASASTSPAAGALVANLIAYKGHADLLDALARLDNPPVVHCFGEGPERSAIEARARSLGLEETLQLHGHVRDVGRRLIEMQFALLVSHEEGLPNAVLEAMAVGLPVVATAVGGTPELIAHGRTGLLVPPRDPVALSVAIASVASDAELRERLGTAARREVQDRFGWSRCVEAHLEIYGNP